MRYEKAQGYFAAAYLVEKSPYHCCMDEEQFKRCIVTPIEEGTFVAGYGENGMPYMFLTYAFPEQEHIDEYYATGDFPKEGYYGNGSIPFIVDFICMTGMRDIKSSLIYIKNMFDRMGYSEYRSFRVDRQKKGWVSW